MMTLISLAVIVVSLSVFAIRLSTNRASVLAVDLTGGTSIVYSLDQAKKPAVGDIRKAMDAFDNAAIIQYQEGVGDATLLVKTGETAETVKGRALENRDVGAYVTKLLQAKFPEAALKQVSVDEVGSMVGADLKKSGTSGFQFIIGKTGAVCRSLTRLFCNKFGNGFPLYLTVGKAEKFLTGDLGTFVLFCRSGPEVFCVKTVNRVAVVDA